MSNRWEIVGEERAYSRYLTVFDRKIRFSNRSQTDNITTRELNYDVVGHPRSEFKFAVVLPFHSARPGLEASVTLVHEYCQGPNTMGYSAPAGCYEPHKHANLEECARAELSEEAFLRGGEWIRLISPHHPGIPEVKWCANRFVPFLVIDPEEDPHPGERDPEEDIQIVKVTISELKNMLSGGTVDMMLPSITTCYMALDVLKERGLL
ncbi:hypothetical protein CEUSTIGMA_g8839.t1 [Chlamydomonas eustigma]|uniref:Nudix hydrolase domain-containing protein n=1 Tax=Chlamydomonas eustigma TaxID=1157962 RepID=A0A250XEQ8_9CHLO|nr:hypothetical protein CEUSTIGMA_g8839.t1 [Chlamydomonas eustigma]|eukprot:GAX81409.1 hypothetical protein CEUSTIGMA_g8839.t1 [Chlamydomonas eustigma]